MNKVMEIKLMIPSSICGEGLANEGISCVLAGHVVGCVYGFSTVSLSSDSIYPSFV
jgi:hypothetical protein